MTTQHQSLGAHFRFKAAYVIATVAVMGLEVYITPTSIGRLRFQTTTRLPSIRFQRTAIPTFVLLVERKCSGTGTIQSTMYPW